MLEIFDIPHIITTYGYLGIFVIVFLESGIFFPLPGDSLLFAAGLFAGAFGLNIFALIGLSFVATFLGSLAGYEIGKHLVKLHNYSFFRKILSQKHIDSAHEFFEKHGKFAITFCRFVPIVRTFVPIVAGVAKMHYMSFIKYNFLGSLFWSSVVTSLGFFLGDIFPGIKNYLWVVSLIVISISVVPILWGLIAKRMQKRERN
jgi:membrane-associated protein